jgi:DNA-binding transcriptional LysR family regulator
MPHVGMLPEALPVFRRKFPKIKLHIIEGLYPAIEAGLRNGTVDFYMGATPQSVVAPGLVSEKLFENTRTIVCRKNHPLGKAKSIRDLAAAQWATTSLSHNASDDLNSLFDGFGMSPPDIMLQAQSTMSVMVALAYSDLLAILPVQWNEFPLTRGHLQVIPVQESLPAPDVVCIRRADLPMTPAAEHLYDLLRRHGPD